MTVVILTLGSAGDVHPFIGIGLALRRRGHKVVFITNPYFGAAADRAGLQTVPLGTVEEFAGVVANPDVWHSRRGVKVVFDIAASNLRRMYDAVVAHLDPDTVVVGSSLAWAARCAQDQFGFPMATVHLSPAQFRSAILPPKLPGLFMPAWLPLWLKQRIWEGGDKYVLDRLIGPALNAFRAQIGLPPVSRILDGWWNSPDRVIGLFPDWYCRPQADWPPQAVLTGFPRYDESDTGAVDPRNPGLARPGEALQCRVGVPPRHPGGPGERHRVGLSSRHDQRLPTRDRSVGPAVMDGRGSTPRRRSAARPSVRFDTVACGIPMVRQRSASARDAGPGRARSRSMRSTTTWPCGSSRARVRPSTASPASASGAGAGVGTGQTSGRRPARNCRRSASTRAGSRKRRSSRPKAPRRRGARSTRGAVMPTAPAPRRRSGRCGCAGHNSCSAGAAALRRRRSPASPALRGASGRRAVRASPRRRRRAENGGRRA